MSTLFFREPRFVALLALTLIAAGASALLAIGRQEDPTITNLFATVTTLYPGAEPARVEALVTEPIETALQDIADVDLIESSSAPGVSIVQLELIDTLDDAAIDAAWADVRAALDGLDGELPAGTGTPDFDRSAAGAWSMIGALTITRDKENVPLLATVRRYADVLATDLRRIAGTDAVELFGVPDEEILVEIEPRGLASMSLTAADVAGALRTADAKVSAGQLRGARQNLAIELDGELDSVERVERVPLQGDDARIVRVGDVANVRKAVRMPATELAFADGAAAVLIAARIEDDRQIDVWMNDARAAVARFDDKLPDGLSHHIVFDQSAYTAERLSDVGINMAIGVALVVLVLLITLGLRAALIVALVLPLVSLAAVATMNLIGLPIQQMSLTGLIVALGLLVDAAIVMTDEIGKRLRAGLSRSDAVGESVHRLTAPLLASTVTTALSFLPLALLPGAAGDFVGSIAIAVIIMLLWSFFIAMTVTAALAGWMLPMGSSGQRTHASFVRVADLFERTIGLALRYPIAAIMFSLVLPLIGFASMGTLVQQFFPGVERDQFHLEVELAEGTPITRTRETVLALDRKLRAAQGVEQVSWVLGKSAPPFYYNMVGDRDRASHYAQALVRSASPEATASLVPELQRTLGDEVPEARVIVRDLVQGPPVTAPVELRLVGPDLEVLTALGERYRAVLSATDSIVVTRATLEGGAPKLVFDIDETAARIAGFGLTDVAALIDSTLEGETGGSIIDATEELPVRVRAGVSSRANLADIVDLPIVLPARTGEVVEGEANSPAFDAIPLSAIATARLAASTTAIARRDTERVNTIQGFISYGLLPAEALIEVQAALNEADIELPPSYRLEFGGDAGDRNDTVNDLLASLGIIVTLSIASVVCSLGSFRLSLVTILVAGLSAGLSFLALAVFRYPFGINALIGIIGSIGVSINAALIILTALKQDARAAAGDVEAMVRVVTGSGRHIVSTTLTTFGGFLPIDPGRWRVLATVRHGDRRWSSVVDDRLVRLRTADVPAAVRRNRYALTAQPADVCRCHHSAWQDARPPVESRCRSREPRSHRNVG